MPSGTAPAETVTVLSISANEKDHVFLETVFDRSESSVSVKSKWAIHPARTLQSALPVLRNNRIPIVVSERDLFPGSWKDVLAAISTLPDPPLLIVTSRLADEYLWSEVLNLGAYDVLAKPFHAEEVIRVLSSAWFHKKKAGAIKKNGSKPKIKSVVAG